MRVNARVVVVLLVLVGCGETHVETQGVVRTSEALTAVASSVIDIGLSNQGPEYNGIGTTRRTDPQLPSFTLSGSSGYDTRVLLRFAMPTLPAGSQVTAATMQISLEAWDNRLNL